MNAASTDRRLPGTYFEVLGLLVLHESLFIAEHPVAVVAPRGLLVLLLFPLSDHSCALASCLLSPSYRQAQARWFLICFTRVGLCGAALLSMSKLESSERAPHSQGHLCARVWQRTHARLSVLAF